MRINYQTLAMALVLVVSVSPAISADIPPASQPAEPMPVFILAGQSNMNGSGVVAELPEELKKPTPDVLYISYWGLDFKPLDLSKAKSFGPEVTFGREMAKALGRPVGLAKLAYGGTSLERDWNPANLAKGSLYLRLLEYARNIKKKNPNVRIAGIIWMQGEADARYFSKTVEQYREKLEALIDGIRKEFGGPAMPFVAGRIDFYAAQYRQQVRQAQATVNRPGYAWFDCDDLERHADKLHFNTKGQIELGKRFAASMIKLLNQPAATTAPDAVPTGRQ